MESDFEKKLISLDPELPIWRNFFTVSPLVLIGTRDDNGEYNVAPKHMAFPMGWDNFFGFLCTPAHTTYQNIIRENGFTVTYPRPTQVVLTSISATPRDDDNLKTSLLSLKTFAAKDIDGLFVADGYIYLECSLHKIVEGFGRNSLITGHIIAAYVHEDAYRTSEQDDAELINEAPLLAYLEPGRFGRIDQTFAFPFPKDFKR
jgi:flavin reductase (DIM6/NTAB) family NADH-FMN oxidoreductase RutF